MFKMKRLWVVGFAVLLLAFLGVANAQFEQMAFLQGTVTLSTTGEPVANFAILITNLDTQQSALLVTDQNGYYSSPIIAGSYQISTVDTVNYEPFSTTIQVAANDTATVDISLVPKTHNSAIAGHVSFKGQGVAGVHVLMFRVIGGTGMGTAVYDSLFPTYVATTDTNGDFFQDVVPGDYLVRVGGSDQYLDWNEFVTVAEGDTVFLDIVLEEFKTISGTVFNANDPAYAWVYVTAHSLNSGRIYFAMPDATGNYVLKVKPGDTYIVRCDGFVREHRSLITIYYDNASTPFEATPVSVQDSVTGVNFTLPTVGDLADFAIEGTVTDETTGEPLANANVGFVSFSMHYSIYNKFHTMTDSMGHYFYQGKTFLAKDSLVGFAIKDGYFAEFYNNQPTYLTADPVYIFPNDTTRGIDFSLTPTPTDTLFSISGTVMGDDGSIPPFGQVIAYSNVGVQYANIDPTTGAYQLVGFPRGTVVVLQAWGGFDYIPEFYNDKLSAEEADTLVINSDRTGIDFVLAHRDLSTALGQVSGQITLNQKPGQARLAEQTDLSGITVYVRKKTDTEWFAADYSNETGQFELPIETYGQYELKATGPGYEDTIVDLEVNESTGLHPTVEIQMTPVTAITPEKPSPIIKTNRLYDAYPNPFNPSTTIRVDMARTEKATLVIYNVLGQKVKVLYNGILKQGMHRFQWNGTDDRGHQVSSGLYFYQLRTSQGIQTKSMLLMK